MKQKQKPKDSGYVPRETGMAYPWSSWMPTKKPRNNHEIGKSMDPNGVWIEKGRRGATIYLLVGMEIETDIDIDLIAFGFNAKTGLFCVKHVRMPKHQ